MLVLSALALLVSSQVSSRPTASVPRPATSLVVGGPGGFSSIALAVNPCGGRRHAARQARRLLRVPDLETRASSSWPNAGVPVRCPEFDHRGEPRRRQVGDPRGLHDPRGAWHAAALAGLSNAGSLRRRGVHVSSANEAQVAAHFDASSDVALTQVLVLRGSERRQFRVRQSRRRWSARDRFRPRARSRSRTASWSAASGGTGRHRRSDRRWSGRARRGRSVCERRLRLRERVRHPRRDGRRGRVHRPLPGGEPSGPRRYGRCCDPRGRRYPRHRRSHSSIRRWRPGRGGPGGSG